MTPSQLSTQLRHIAAKISNSKSPRRDLIARDLKNLINKLSDDNLLQLLVLNGKTITSITPSVADLPPDTDPGSFKNFDLVGTYNDGTPFSGYISVDTESRDWDSNLTWDDSNEDFDILEKLFDYIYI